MPGRFPNARRVWLRKQASVDRRLERHAWPKPKRRRNRPTAIRIFPRPAKGWPAFPGSIQLFWWCESPPTTRYLPAAQREHRPPARSRFRPTECWPCASVHHPAACGHCPIHPSFRWRPRSAVIGQRNVRRWPWPRLPGILQQRGAFLPAAPAGKIPRWKSPIAFAPNPVLSTEPVAALHWQGLARSRAFPDWMLWNPVLRREIVQFRESVLQGRSVMTCVESRLTREQTVPM